MKVRVQFGGAGTAVRDAPEALEAAGAPAVPDAVRPERSTARPRFWQPRKDEFRYPMEPVPRTAVLVPWFGTPRSAKGPVRVFADGWCGEAARFAPEAIALTPEQMEALAGLPAMAPTHALILLHLEGGTLLTAGNRDGLWRQFGVPVFEQIVGRRGRLLAAECEAHDGLHILADQISAGPMGPDAYVDRSPCACGRTTPRLKLAGPSDRPVGVALPAREPDPVPESALAPGSTPARDYTPEVRRSAARPTNEELRAVAAYAR